MSLKSVPACLVSIAPTGIGVPVAATPGFGPHEDVLVLAVFVVLLVVLDDELDDVVVVVELLPQAAIAKAPTTAAKAAPNRTLPGVYLMVLTLSPLLHALA